MADKPFDATEELVPTAGGLIGINLGTGPVRNASQSDADANIVQFVADVDRPGTVIETPPGTAIDDGSGRFEYVLLCGEYRCEVAMPGLATEHVRYLGEEEQNILDFPRLYVDGSSWVWEFAIGSARRALDPEEESDGD